jgi:hydroxyacylglutathione hydrolase
MEIRAIDLGFVNCFLIKTEAGFFLIDTGMAVHRGRLEQELDEAGCWPDRLRLIILTHADADHVGNAVYLRATYRSRIAMHELDAQVVADGERQVGSMRRKKVRGFVMKAMFGAMRFFLALPFVRAGMAARFVPFRPDVLLSEGQSLREFGLDATVLHLPGHTPGSIGIVTAGKDVFVGDLLRSDRRPLLSPLGEDFEEMATQARRLAVMRLNTAYPGHGKAFRMSDLSI